MSLTWLEFKGLGTEDDLLFWMFLKLIRAAHHHACEQNLMQHPHAGKKGLSLIHLVSSVGNGTRAARDGACSTIVPELLHSLIHLWKNSGPILKSPVHYSVTPYQAISHLLLS